MAESSIFTDLFEKQSMDAWRRAAEKELKGKSYEEFLQWTNKRLSLDSYQNEAPKDKASLVPQHSPWKILTAIYHEDAQEANKAALDALMNGAEGIWFEKSFQGAAAEVATQKIDQSIAPVFINYSSFYDPHVALYKGTKSSVDSGNKKNFLCNGLRLRERGADALSQVSYCLSMGIELLQTGVAPGKILFKIGIGTSLLTEIAAIRAFKWLWHSILEQEGHSAENPMIIATNLCIGYPKTDQHTNLLRATSSAMSAVCGGVNYIILEPWNKSWESKASSPERTFANRISRNIQLLLKDEGRFDKNLNPVDGSYFLEQLTTRSAKTIWVEVREIEELGFSDWVTTGRLRTSLERTANQLIEAYQNDQRWLIGVNKFQPSTIETEKPPGFSSYPNLPPQLHLPSKLMQQ